MKGIWKNIVGSILMAKLQAQNVSLKKSLDRQSEEAVLTLQN
jgi:hypothetical protein